MKDSKNANISFISYDGCRYTRECNKFMHDRDSSYEPYLYLIDKLRVPMQKALNLTDQQAKEMNFQKLIAYADTVFCRLFEGVHVNYKFDSE